MGRKEYGKMGRWKNRKMRKWDDGVMGRKEVRKMNWKMGK